MTPWQKCGIRPKYRNSVGNVNTIIHNANLKATLSKRKQQGILQSHKRGVQSRNPLQLNVQAGRVVASHQPTKLTAK